MQYLVWQFREQFSWGLVHIIHHFKAVSIVLSSIIKKKNYLEPNANHWGFEVRSAAGQKSGCQRLTRERCPQRGTKGSWDCFINTLLVLLTLVDTGHSIYATADWLWAFVWILTWAWSMASLNQNTQCGCTHRRVVNLINKQWKVSGKPYNKENLSLPRCNWKDKKTSLWNDCKHKGPKNK